MMDASTFDMGDIDIAWCPGCGNYPILKTLKEAVAELQIDPTRLVMVSGIGQAAKIPHYLRAHVFNGLHGRALPPATAIKAANPSLTVIAESGDGDMYGEGGNHFIHCIRRNPNITNIVHDNRVYGLTKGQASPTSPLGFTTPVQVHGVCLEPFNPLAVAIALNAGFVARANAQDREQTKDLMKKAITHRGYALLDILQPCVTYNKLNTYQWFKEHTYYLDESHDPHDRMAAFQRATETDKLPLGVLYISPDKLPFEDNTGVYRDDSRPLHERQVDVERLGDLMNSLAANA
ncbi:MAG TPA: thiamine pyrophosphate-dependent enzyme [Sedimentisphaerales bacterium]|jgi:2-oxoglutarate ferredoxin oxidoreductase subunit beta|nr:thiamine pyrophosphate-dependent enzyme [Sedimentisphaerales bacterium]HNU29863.1 thiamine pyrophosphate-dependent enzyme [Sedimentisphaerales bacterium]